MKRQFSAKHTKLALSVFPVGCALIFGMPFITPVLAQEPAAANAQTSIDPNATVTPVTPPEPPRGAPTLYDPDLERLATILGSLHYLRNLCGEAGDDWRRKMESMLVADKMEGERRTRAIAAFNDGYRAFSETYSNCNTQAASAISRFQTEGADLTSKLLTRYRS
jgi:uncharacterized protein (TIGR02301 family)